MMFVKLYFHTSGIYLISLVSLDPSGFYLRTKYSKLGCKDQELIQSSTTPDPGYQWESDKLTVDTTNESQEVSSFSAGDHKAHINRRAQRQSKHKTEQKHKRSTKEDPWNVQLNILLEGLNRFNGATLTLNSDIDQDT